MSSGVHEAHDVFHASTSVVPRGLSHHWNKTGTGEILPDLLESFVHFLM